MPRLKQPEPGDDELVLSELRALAPMGLTKYDVADELRLPTGYATALLGQLVDQGRVKIKASDRNRQNKLYYVDVA